MVTATSKKLPLRPIYSVDVRPEKWVEHQHVVVDLIEIRLNQPEWNDDKVDYESPDYEASVIDGDFDAVFCRLQHVHVRHFDIDISDNPFMQFWKAKETAFTAKRIEVGFAPGDADYGLFDYPVAFDVELDESSWNEGGYNREYLDLFRRESSLNYIKTCELKVFGGGLPGMTFLLGEIGYAVYEIICFEVDAVGWCDRLFEAFLHGTCRNEKLESICIQWDVPQGISQTSPMPKLLDKPTETNVQVPRADFVTCRITGDYEVSQCSLYSFPIATHQKRLDVFKWATSPHDMGGRETTYALVFELKHA